MQHVATASLQGASAIARRDADWSAPAPRHFLSEVAGPGTGSPVQVGRNRECTPFRASVACNERTAHPLPDDGRHAYRLGNIASMVTVSVTIDGRSGSFAEGTTVLAAARQLGIDIPTLCDDARLEPSGACRLCLVDVTGAAKPVAACAAPLVEGMEIRTTSDLLEAERRVVLEMLAREYPAAAVLEEPDKPFHRYLRAAGVVAEGPSAPPETMDESHPYLRADMSRCIDCYRCVRICADLQGQDVWHLRDRGAETVVHPAGPSLLESPCVACGACVDTCPTGALEDRSIRSEERRVCVCVCVNVSEYV